MKRLHQTVLIVSFIPLCWFAMMGVHEAGHVLAGWLTGGEVQKVVLHPLAISRTDVEPNPQPLIVVWSGPVLGITLPVLLWVVFNFAKIRGEYLPRFFAGFCLIANGAYIGVGSFDRIGDAGEMLKQASPIWTLWLFGLLTIPLGFWLWRRQGIYFGLGESQGKVEINAAYVSLLSLIFSLILLFSLSPRS